ncbi:Inner membrane protein YjjP [Vibrio sp. NH-UV-68]
MAQIRMESKQRAVSRLIAQAGQMLLAHGAESTLVGELMHRFGIAADMDEVEVSLSASSLVVTTVANGFCITTTRRCSDKGINMRVVTQVQRTCILLERGIIDYEMAQRRLNTISPERYNRWLVVVMIGLSCASFSRLAGGDWMIFVMTFVASAIAMVVRQEIAHRHFNPLFNFTVTAFVATLVASQAVKYGIGNSPSLVMASSVLLLVPGFPLINAAADMLKGYVNIGISRFVMASLLVFATSLGIVAAMNLADVWEWVI